MKKVVKFALKFFLKCATVTRSWGLGGWGVILACVDLSSHKCVGVKVHSSNTVGNLCSISLPCLLG